jgi:hypothetical protein
VVLAGVAAVVLALGRPAGVAVIGAVLVFAAIALADRTGPRELARRKDVRVAALATITASTLAVAWMVVARTTDVGSHAVPIRDTITGILRTVVLTKFDRWAQETVGVFGYHTVRLPGWLLYAWAALQGLLLLLGVALAARRRHALTIVAIPLLCFAAGLVVDVALARFIGYFMQGRYFLPLWVGIFFLAALAIPGRLLPERALRRVYLLSFAVWGFTMLFGLYLLLDHFQYGPRGSATFALGWRPGAGILPPYLVVAAGIALTGWLVRWHLREHATRETQGAAAREPQEDTGRSAQVQLDLAGTARAEPPLAGAPGAKGTGAKATGAKATTGGLG